MKSLFVLLFSFCLVVNTFAQDKTEKTVELSEVTVGGANHTYLDAVLDDRFPELVANLETKAALYDISLSKVFSEDIDIYEVTFAHENGHIIATYDQDGMIRETIERYYNITFPEDIRQQVFANNPGWLINKDAYVVAYDHDRDVKKTGKFQLMRNGKKKNVTIEF